jgi:hypothetical protein
MQRLFIAPSTFLGVHTEHRLVALWRIVPMADNALDASEKEAQPFVSVAGVHCALTFAHPSTQRPDERHTKILKPVVLARAAAALGLDVVGV